MNFGLSAQVIIEINNILAMHPNVEQALIYGSRALGTSRHNSDIDLVLKGPNISLSDLSKINWQLDDLLLPYTIDLSILHHIKQDDLLEHIRQAGKVFYSRNNSR